MPGHGTSSFLSNISPCQLALSAGALLLAGYIIGPSISGNSRDKSSGMLGSRREALYVTGLVNRANDCFANSILQALAGSSILHSFLAENAQFGKLTSALLHSITELNRLSRTQRCLSPWPFLHVIEQIYHSRISASQHDAHELLHVILETISNEYDSHLKKIGLKPSENSRPPFEGTTLDKLVCQRCGHSPKVTTSSYVVLSLVVPQQWHASLDKCLANFFGTEIIQDYGCANCRLQALKSSQKSPEMLEKLQDCDADNLSPEIEAMLPKSITSTLAKKTSLGLLPELFIIHLSRSIFSGSASRNSCRISFKERLALINDASQLTNYRLVAIVRHQGTHYSGHYESYRLKNWPKGAPMTSPDNSEESSGKSSADPVTQVEIDAAHEESIRNGKTWWRINDDKVSSCKLDDVLNQTKAVYLLFYEKIHNQDVSERNSETDIDGI